MQYIVKALMVSATNVIIGAFGGMFLKIMYQMMTATNDVVMGAVLFFVGIGVLILYNVLLKKFVTGDQISYTLPLICMFLGIWISWNYYAVA